MTRAVVAVALAAVVVSTGTAEALVLDVERAELGTDRRPCHGPRFRTDGVGSLAERRASRRVIRCAFRHVVGGQVSTALRVAARESGFDDEALNRSSMASGLFQHLRRYWRGRAMTLPRRVFPNRRRVGAFNAAANAWAAAKMVRRSGWTAWGGA